MYTHILLVYSRLTQWGIHISMEVSQLVPHNDLIIVKLAALLEQRHHDVTRNAGQ